MLDRFSHRLLTLLQFTRAALVLTAVSNSFCTLLLASWRTAPDADPLRRLSWQSFVLVALISGGLYGFGMTLNDIIDRRRDLQLAAHRPLPSGRLRLPTAHLVCGLLLLTAIIACLLYARLDPPASPAPFGWRCVGLLLLTAALITFYDFAGKYLVAPGLVTLGLIRLSHALIPAGFMPLPWHPMLLFTHVTLLSAVAYSWEEKRPHLTRAHWLVVSGGILLIDLLILAASGFDTSRIHIPARPAMFLPLILAGAFVLVAWAIRRRSSSSRQAGQTLMLTGLLWLIAYDAAFVAAYVRSWLYAISLVLLLPVSYLLVLLLRWWSKLVLLSQQPTYKRVRSGPQPQKP